MENHNQATPNEASSRRRIPSVSRVFDDGTILELVYDPTEHRTAFAISHEGASHIAKQFNVGDADLVPYSANNDLIKNNAIVLPSKPEPYESEQELILAIRRYIHRYVDLSPIDEKLATYYTLFTWIFDAFNEVPYLRAVGDFGSGKSRFLLIVGSLCYKAFFASGASTPSPLFHTINTFRGTLVMDEADFFYSDLTAQIVKILNAGTTASMPIFRSMVSDKGEVSPRAFHVFGPKIIAARNRYKDVALESRFLTITMARDRLRKDIPYTLPESFREESLHLRNQLLAFRFENLGKIRPREDLVDRSIEPRLNQMFVPLLSIIEDPTLRAELRSLAQQYHHDLVSARGGYLEAHVLEAIKQLSESSSTDKLSIKEITREVQERFGDEHDGEINPKIVGLVVRNKLRLKTRKSHGIFVIPSSEHSKILHLYQKYGISSMQTDELDKTDGQSSVDSTDRVDMGMSLEGRGVNDPEITREDNV
jgi:hypothetical protein